MTAEEVVSNMADNTLEDSDEYLTHHDVELYLKKNPEFTKKFVYKYLSSHLDFADEFFQAWYDNMIGLSLKRGSRKATSNGNINTSLSDDSAFFVDEEEEEVYNNHDHHQYSLTENNVTRRRSDPITNNNTSNTNNNNNDINSDIKKLIVRSGSEECLDTIDEDVVTRAGRSSSMVLPKEARYRTTSVDDNNNLGNSIDALKLPANNPSVRANKPHLRKAQSAPTYKKKLSNLIRSSVFSGASGSGGSKHINVENHTELRELNESHYIVKIIKDISKDMSLNNVCFKILVNLGFLLDIEKASIFLVQQSSNSKDKKILKLLLDNVSIAKGVRKESLSSSLSKQPQIVPIGSGIIGHVAETGESLFVNSISSFDNYHPQIDCWWSHGNTKNALLQPVKNSDGETIAVIVGLNKKGGQFLEEDRQIGESFLSYCGISITNALIFELTKEEFERNKMLLEFSHDIFEEQSSLANAIQKILNKALEMFNCKRASLMLLDDPKDIEERQVFSKLFQITSEEDKKEKRFSKFQRDSMVFSSNFDPFSDVVDDTHTLKSKKQKKMILSSTPVSSVPAGIQCEEGLISIPVRNSSSQIIGVLKLYDRKETSGLSLNEEQFLEAFAIFAGLGINNCMMYDNIVKGQAHQKVALEALSYHTAARQTDVDKLKSAVIPTCNKFHLTSFAFDDFSLLDHEMLASSVRMFMEFGFLKKFQIDYEVLCRFLITVKNNYRRVIYHNWRHAFNVTQTMFAMLTSGKMSEQLSSSECLALLVGCLCHDLDHRGTNNEFQMKTDSPLQKLYGTSTMEQHHFNCAVTILNSEGNNIFAHLQSPEYRKVMKLLKHAILATDLSNYIRQREKFSNAVETKTLDTSSPESRAMLRSMLMTASDLSGITKPWEIQKRVVHLVTSEFFHQGDIERDKLHVQPKQMMDRNYILQLPKLQVNFFQFMGIPVYKVLSDYNPLLNPYLEGAKSNKSTWAKMNAEIEKGHVHPDIEPVLHPVRQDEL